MWAPHRVYLSFGVQGLKGPFCFIQSWCITVLGTMFSFYLRLGLPWLSGLHFVCLTPVVRQLAGPILFSEIWVCQGSRWEESFFWGAQLHQVVTAKQKAPQNRFANPSNKPVLQKKRFGKQKGNKIFPAHPIAINPCVFTHL